MSLFSVSFFSFIFNYKIVSVSCHLLHFYHTLIFFLLTLYFPLFSSCSLYPHFFSFIHFTLSSSVLSFRSFVFYANFSLSAIAISPRGAGIFAFTPAKAFVRELKCPAITRLVGKYHLSCDAISSWLIVIALSYSSRNS